MDGALPPEVLRSGSATERLRGPGLGRSSSKNLTRVNAAREKPVGTGSLELPERINISGNPKVPGHRKHAGSGSHSDSKRGSGHSRTHGGPGSHSDSKRVLRGFSHGLKAEAEAEGSPSPNKLSNPRSPFRGHWDKDKERPKTRSKTGERRNGHSSSGGGGGGNDAGGLSALEQHHWHHQHHQSQTGQNQSHHSAGKTHEQPSESVYVYAANTTSAATGTAAYFTFNDRRSRFFPEASPSYGGSPLRQSAMSVAPSTRASAVSPQKQEKAGAGGATTVGASDGTRAISKRAKRISAWGRWYVTLVCCMIACLYVSFVWLVSHSAIVTTVSWIPYGLLLPVFHLVFFLFIWAFVQSSRVHPGPVPANWAFHLGDVRKRTRYCNACHVWKPERCHHCSTCNRCSLNMDHHCPWLNNCIGFYNRKFFIQTLVYAFTLLCIYVIALVFFALQFIAIFLGSWLFGSVIPSTTWGSDDARPSSDAYPSVRARSEIVDTLLTSAADGAFFDEASALFSSYWLVLEPLLTYAGWLICVLGSSLAVVSLFTVGQFAVMHLKLVKQNLTTIEWMDAQSREKSRYDLGVQKNLEQVMGSNALLWWLPLHTKSSAPAGDGVRWHLRNDLYDYSSTY